MGNNAKYYLFESMAFNEAFNERHVWLQVIDSPIGSIYAVQYEKPHMELETKLFYDELDKAMTYYKRICKKMVDGKI